MKAFSHPRGLNQREREVEEGKWKGTSGRISSKEGGGYQNCYRDMDVMTDGKYQNCCHDMDVMTCLSIGCSSILIVLHDSTLTFQP
jgi:hypothetical protein